MYVALRSRQAFVCCSHSHTTHFHLQTSSVKGLLETCMLCLGHGREIHGKSEAGILTSSKLFPSSEDNRRHSLLQPMLVIARDNHYLRMHFFDVLKSLTRKVSHRPRRRIGRAPRHEL